MYAHWSVSHWLLVYLVHANITNCCMQSFPLMFNATCIRNITQACNLKCTLHFTVTMVMIAVFTCVYPCGWFKSVASQIEYGSLQCLFVFALIWKWSTFITNALTTCCLLHIHESFITCYIAIICTEMLFIYLMHVYDKNMYMMTSSTISNLTTRIFALKLGINLFIQCYRLYSNSQCRISLRGEVV